MTQRTTTVLEWIAGGLVMLLGVIHAGLTFAFYAKANLGAVWFFGCGLWLITVGAIRIAAHRHACSRMLSMLATSLAAAFAVVVLWVAFLPQAALLLALLILGLGLDTAALRTARNSGGARGTAAA